MDITFGTIFENKEKQFTIKTLLFLAKKIRLRKFKFGNTKPVFIVFSARASFSQGLFKST